MVAQNLKEFNNEWILFGLLFFSLMTFATIFMAENNQDGLGSSQAKFDTYSSNVQSNLVAIDANSNDLLNISIQNNPEASFLGSRDSVATSYGLFGNAKKFLDDFKLFMSWILIGTAGQLLVSVFVGMFGLTALYFIYKWIRGN